MNNKYTDDMALFKAFSDINRLMIIEMLSGGELCACKILEAFNFTQPTLSHHMKILCACGLVKGRREGKWMHYSLSLEKLHQCKSFLNDIINTTEGVICKRAN